MLKISTNFTQLRPINSPKNLPLLRLYLQLVENRKIRKRKEVRKSKEQNDLIHPERRGSVMAYWRGRVSARKFVNYGFSIFGPFSFLFSISLLFSSCFPLFTQPLTFTKNTAKISIMALVIISPASVSRHN